MLPQYYSYFIHELSGRFAAIYYNNNNNNATITTAALADSCAVMSCRNKLVHGSFYEHFFFFCVDCTKPRTHQYVRLSEPHAHETASPMIYLSMYLCVYISYVIL